MNLATVLMCWNVPPISEDLLYELFSNAGPIEEISFAKNGKSCFVVYEHADAVITARDIFKDVKLDGRPLKMFDHDEISKIYSQQEEQIAQTRNYKYENPSPNFNSRSYEGPYQHFSYNRNVPDHWGSDRYSESNRRSQSHNSTPSNQPEQNDHRDRRANAIRSTSISSYSNSSQSRPDLLPSQPSKARKFDAETTFGDLLNASNGIIDLMNPYNMPVSRNSPGVQDCFSNRSSHQYFHDYDADFSRNSTQGRRSRNQEDFDHGGVFNNSANQGDQRHHRNKYDNHSSHYRDHPYRDHSDREPHTRGPKFTNSSPSAANYKSRNPYSGKRDHKYRGQQSHRSRRH